MPQAHHAVLLWKATSHHRSATGCANRAGHIATFERNSACRQRIKIWRLYLRVVVSYAAVGLVVGENDDDVGFAINRSDTIDARECQQKSGKQCEGRFHSSQDTFHQPERP